MSHEIEKIEESMVEEKVIPAQLHILTRTVLTLVSCGIAYLLTATHFLISVRAAHFLGDASYIPPSILRFTGILFRVSEVAAAAQILFFVVWMILVIVSCVVIFYAAACAVYMFVGLFTDDKPLHEAVGDCFVNGILCLSPVLILSVLTLLIMPLESTHLAAESISLSQIGELMPFSEFLFTMTQGTVVIFLVCFFVVITCIVAYLLTLAYPGGGEFFFFIAMFIGVCVGVAVLMILGHYIYIAVDLVQLATGNSYLTHYSIFGVYTLVCTVLILPSAINRTDEIPAEAKENQIAQLKRGKKSKKNKIRQQPADAVTNS